MTLPEAKAPDPIRQLCIAFLTKWRSSLSPFQLHKFVMEQRAAARAEAFEEARQIAHAQYAAVADPSDASAIIWRARVETARSTATQIELKIRDRAAQEANHDQS